MLSLATNLVVVLMLSIFLTSCVKSIDPPDATVNKIEVVVLDRTWVFESEQYRQVFVKLTPLEFAVGKRLYCSVINGTDTLTFRLLDDGGRAQFDREFAFVDTVSGDAIGGDGVFSRRMNSLFADRTGEFKLEFTVFDGIEKQLSSNLSIQVLANSIPQFVDFVHTDSLSSGSQGALFSTYVRDADGFEDITDIRLEIFRSPSDINNAFEIDLVKVNDSIYNRFSLPEFAVGLPTGNYSSFFKMRDNIMTQMEGEQWVKTNEFTLWLENTPPEIYTVTGLDTFWITKDIDTIYYSIYVRDLQTQADLAKLHLDFVRHDGTRPPEPIAPFLDNGRDPDKVAGDGWFDVKLLIGGSASTGVTHTLNWIPEDKSGQIGETYVSSLTIMRESSILRESNQMGAGIAIFNKSKYNIIE